MHSSIIDAFGRDPTSYDPFRPAHAVILGVFLLIRYVMSDDAGLPSGGGGHDTGGSASGGHGDSAGGHAAAGGEHGDDGHHGYQVFHVEFERVQLPFIISLWIFVSSLAKIGKGDLYKFAQ